MFCKLPRTVSSAHLSLVPASSFRHLFSLLLNRVTKTPVTQKAVLSPSTVKRFLEASKLAHKDGHHAALTLTCPLCARETSQTASSSARRPGEWCALRARPTVSWSALVRGPSAWSCSIPMHCTYARVCVSTCLCSVFGSNCELATVT